MTIKPYVFGHRGAMGYCIENTIDCFRKAVEMGAGIEADLQRTKDNEIVIFHDPAFRNNSRWYRIKSLTLKELRAIEFKDKRRIPQLKELFETFLDGPKSLRYSFDISDYKVGQALIETSKQYGLLEIIEITDTRIHVLNRLRKFDKSVKLILTLPHDIVNISPENTNFTKLKEIRVKTINLRSNRAKLNNFKTIIDNGFNCYVWNVDSKIIMKRILNLNYKGKHVKALYTDYPDILINLRDQIFP
ncbi:MAG: glycerophosphodiester phosphodiesterase [Promethearchaeota archaeon]